MPDFGGSGETKAVRPKERPIKYEKARKVALDAEDAYEDAVKSEDAARIAKAARAWYEAAQMAYRSASDIRNDRDRGPKVDEASGILYRAQRAFKMHGGGMETTGDDSAASDYTGFGEAAANSTVELSEDADTGRAPGGTQSIIDAEFEEVEEGKGKKAKKEGKLFAGVRAAMGKVWERGKVLGQPIKELAAGAAIGLIAKKAVEAAGQAAGAAAGWGVIAGAVAGGAVAA